MNATQQKLLMWLFGVTAIAGFAFFLMQYEPSPGLLSAPHANAMSGSGIRSCDQCHAEDGLTSGCLSCHEEIQAQVTGGTGYHAYLFQGLESACETCHSEHHGEEFPLVSSLSWTDESSNTFSHPHIEFGLTGSHSNLSCEVCHDKAEPLKLPGFEEHPRGATFLGLNQDCISCHENIHETEETRSCSDCHDQKAFVPASNFDHAEFFKLEGPHATASCSACHSDEVKGRTFGAVKGRSCIDCHETPHVSPILGNECISCHNASDGSWAEGARGIDAALHAQFRFSLDAPHQTLECSACHAGELKYTQRFPSPARAQNQCQACHDDPHGGQFESTHSSCLSCHQPDRFTPSKVGLSNHTKHFPLTGAHQAVACVQCHAKDPVSKVRIFAGVATACKSCHENPHGPQFNDQLKVGDCTVCHSPDAGAFEIRPYAHRGNDWFFAGNGHRQADCRQCHQGSSGNEPLVYAAAPTTCASCHADPHRGQFRVNEENDCRRCHSSPESWAPTGFNHETGTSFPLAGSHSKVSCAACHRPAPQPDGRPVVQYRPLTTRCEDCHGFDAK